MIYYVINLDRRPDRRIRVTQKLLQQGFGSANVTFFSAVDGKTLVVDPFTRHIFRENTFQSLCGVVGCALSHFYVILEFLRSKDSCCTIFEDDIDFLPQTTPTVIEEIVPRIPACDLIFLGYHTTTQYNLPDRGIIGFTRFHPGKYLGGTFAYVLTRAGAQKIYEHIVLHGIQEAIDGFYRQLLKNGVITAYEIGPRLVTSQWLDTETPDVDSDIQRDNCALPI